MEKQDFECLNSSVQAPWNPGTGSCLPVSIFISLYLCLKSDLFASLYIFSPSRDQDIADIRWGCYIVNKRSSSRACAPSAACTGLVWMWTVTPVRFGLKACYDVDISVRGFKEAAEEKKIISPCACMKHSDPDNPNGGIKSMKNVLPLRVWCCLKRGYELWDWFRYLLYFPFILCDLSLKIRW